jgi:hypothetical protein
MAVVHIVSKIMEKLIDDYMQYDIKYSLLKLTKYVWETRYNKLTFEYTKLLLLKVLKNKILSGEITYKNKLYVKVNYNSEIDDIKNDIIEIKKNLEEITKKMNNLKSLESSLSEIIPLLTTTIKYLIIKNPEFTKKDTEVVDNLDNDNLDDIIKIKSSNGKKTYSVNKTKKTCECPDYTYRERICKHLNTVGITS